MRWDLQQRATRAVWYWAEKLRIAVRPCVVALTIVVGTSQVNLKTRMPELVIDWHWSKNLTLETRSECNRGMQYVVMVTVADLDALDAYLKHPQHVVRSLRSSQPVCLEPCSRMLSGPLSPLPLAGGWYYPRPVAGGQVCDRRSTRLRNHSLLATVVGAACAEACGRSQCR